MHPALSVILFTTLSGAGYGLWWLLGIHLWNGHFPDSDTLKLGALGLGFALVSAGLLSSTVHLGHPERAWRALSQWRSSWLSREGVAALVAYLPMLALTWLLWHGTGPAAVGATGLALSALALVTVYCTARIYTSLRTVPAWHNAWVLPGFLLLGLYTGGMALWALQALAGYPLTTIPLAALMLMGLAAAVLKLGYWRFIDRQALPVDSASALGLSGRGRVHRFEAPHTESAFLMKEMGFRVARRHAQRLRMLALVLAAILPAIAIFAGYHAPRAQAWLAPPAATAALLGVLLERWLFFAQARHLVVLYYAPVPAPSPANATES
ncbi:MAG TPA: dimethyl sulfoxide reductase anchor subunit [Xanthomonadaceae bacterium]|nr:dimethyl sulfoxide reductase anchor subunit [Xanthomonadaceae bacterium]